MPLFSARLTDSGFNIWPVLISGGAAEDGLGLLPIGAGLVPVEGLEPSAHGVKVRCSPN